MDGNGHLDGRDHGPLHIALADIGSARTLDIYGANWNDRSSTGGAMKLWVNEG